MSCPDLVKQPTKECQINEELTFKDNISWYFNHVWFINNRSEEGTLCICS